jgi:hypothetical protein
MVSIWPTANTPLDYSDPSIPEKEETISIQPGSLLHAIHHISPIYFNLILKAGMLSLFNNPSNKMTFIMTPDEYLPTTFENVDPVFARKLVNYSTLPERITMADFGTLDEGSLRTNLPEQTLTYRKVDTKLYINNVGVIQMYTTRPAYTMILVESPIFKLQS